MAEYWLYLGEYGNRWTVYYCWPFKYFNDLAMSGRGPVDQAAMLMTSVEVRIRDNPDMYFTTFIEALRRSHLGNVADRLVQALPEDQRHST